MSNSTIHRWHREADGTYTAETGPSFNPSTVIGESEFSASIYQADDGVWQLESFTFGLPYFRAASDTLAGAKAQAESALRHITF